MPPRTIQSLRSSRLRNRWSSSKTSHLDLNLSSPSISHAEACRNTPGRKTDLLNSTCPSARTGCSFLPPGPWNTSFTRLFLRFAWRWVRNESQKAILRSDLEKNLRYLASPIRGVGAMRIRGRDGTVTENMRRLPSELLKTAVWF